MVNLGLHNLSVHSATREYEYEWRDDDGVEDVHEVHEEEVDQDERRQREEGQHPLEHSLFLNLLRSLFLERQ